MYDIAIIGAGIIGATIFRELTKYDVNIVLIEKENDVALGTTKANSAIVHAGYDPVNGTLMAKYNVEGNRMFKKLCEELNVPFSENGAMVVAKNEEEMTVVEELFENGVKNGVLGLKVLSHKEVKALEPNITDEVIGALYAPTSGIVGPYEFTIACVENGIRNGGKLLLNREIVSIEKNHVFKMATVDSEVIESKYIINAAGVHADEIHNLICKNTFNILPRKGEYFVMDKTQGELIKQTIFPCPSKLGKGILITPTVHGNLLVGPSAEDIEDKSGINTTMEGLDYIRETASKTVKSINFRETIRNFAGLRAISDKGDFIIGEDEEIKGFIDVAGMKSPGLSCAPAIAADMFNILSASGLQLKKKETFISRREVIRFSELNIYEKIEIIKKDNRYGKIICRCEGITEGEIVDAINRSFGEISIDGVKRRCRPGMGRCQGGFCAPRVQEIIARELRMNIEDVVLDRADSKILIGKTK